MPGGAAEQDGRIQIGNLCNISIKIITVKIVLNNIKEKKTFWWLKKFYFLWACIFFYYHFVCCLYKSVPLCLRALCFSEQEWFSDLLTSPSANTLSNHLHVDVANYDEICVCAYDRWQTAGGWWLQPEGSDSSACCRVPEEDWGGIRKTHKHTHTCTQIYALTHT